MEAPEYFIGGYFGNAGGENKLVNPKMNENTNNQFAVDDLLDFSKEDDVMTDALFDNMTGNSADSSTVTVHDSCNSSVSGSEPPFSGNFSCRSFSDSPFSGSELCIPYDELAELEWLSNLVEDSFSTDDLQNLHLITATTDPLVTDNSSIFTTTTTILHPKPTNNNSSPIFSSDVSVPIKARSKRSRAPPCDWSSRLLLLSPAISSSQNNANNVNTTTAAIIKTTPSKKKESSETPGRKCLHCASDKTPQWRTGPLGPKTLCNACGVRYKSGRLVPEYRPAASPTFVSAKHSNSHRKVVELRRQKELQRHHHQQQQQQQFLGQTSSIFGSNGGDYLLHHHHQSGQSFRHMI